MAAVGGDAKQDPAPRRRRARPEATPTQRALALLTRREHSRKELAAKLEARGIEPQVARTAIETLAGDGWQDDGRFAEFLLRSRANTGHGPVRIRAELGTHGLDRDAIATVLDRFEGDWAANACDLVRRRFGPGVCGDRALQRKAADFLYRRGFEAGQIRAALATAQDG